MLRPCDVCNGYFSTFEPNCRNRVRTIFHQQERREYNQWICQKCRHNAWQCKECNEFFNPTRYLACSNKCYLYGSSWGAVNIFPEKIKVGDEEYPDLAAMALNIAIGRIKKNSKGGEDDAQVQEKTKAE